MCRARAAARRTRRMAAIAGGKMALLASRSLGKGGGTALPGVVAERLDPTIARDLARQIQQGAITVSGTNGKTTTCRMLARILKDAGFDPIRNDSGSNLMRGVASALVSQSGLWGRLVGGARAIGLFEVDEAALPSILEALRPSRVVLLDLFRDQLDRYGEVATIARLWTTALSVLPASTSMVVNADDPLLVTASEAAPGAILYFGVEATGTARDLDHASDVKACPRCGGPIAYSGITLGHLGRYACPGCGLTRPDAAVEASTIVLNGVAGSTFQLRAGDKTSEISLPLPGLYNIYNAIAAAAVAISLGVPLDKIAASLAVVTPAFGRMEPIKVEGRQVMLALAKNPAGLNEVLRATQGSPDIYLLVMLNDRTADGHDVSWIWDADVDLLRDRVRSVVFGGNRAADMALRFKYDGILDHGKTPDWAVETDTATSFDRALSWTPAGATLFVIPTYTALLDLRNLLAKRGYVRQYWEA